jgi:hypothetical protein
MLRAHSLLWHYLWLAPEVLQVGVAVILYRRRFYRALPVFLAYAIYEALENFTLYTMDVLPSVSAETWWRALWVGLIIEGVIKFAVIGELLRRLIRSQPGLARVGNRLFACAGAGLALLAAVTAAYTTPANSHWLIGGGFILQQTLDIVQCGLILFIFLFAAYFQLSWDRLTFGIALGFAVVFCQHLASRAVMAAVILSNHAHVLLSFLNMATYHLCVLIWCYYLLVPQKVTTTSAVPLPENNLDIWNRELERLLQR